MIHLIRHAHAGDRSRWEGDDRVRPLTDKGRAQSDVIAADLADSGIDVIWTSAHVRCRQTIEPLAELLGVEIVERPELAEGEPGPAALEALLDAAAGGRTVAVCSHGDVIPDIVAAAYRRGADIDGPSALRKAARYEMDVEDGAVVRIVYVPRPEV